MKDDVSFGRGIWLCTLLFLLIVVVLEGGLRLYDLMRGEVLDEDIQVQIALSRSNDHPYLQYTSLKNFRGRIQNTEPGKLFRVETNSDGFRTHEFYPKPDGTYRILLLGDSFVYGANADQDETLGVKLEQGLKKILNEDIEVLSLGVSSYSGLRYAVLMRLYLDKLDPDMVIVAVDQSDLQEDVDRLDHYRLDQDGYPVILKSAEELMRTQGHNRIVIDSEGKLKVEERGRNWLLDMRITSRLFDRTYRLAASIRHRILNSKAASIYAEDHGGDIIRYETLVSEHGTDLSAVLPKRMQVDTIPFDLETAVKRYEPTLRSLRYIKRETASRGMELILTSYPYPWMVSIREALPYQLLGFNAIYDFRSNRVHPNLMDRYAEELDITHLNAYPVFENQTRRLYGNYDPHFNADGYARYAEFLTSSIRDLLNKDTAGASSLLP